jgi:hypothetical protein
MKTYGRVDGLIHVTLTLAVDGGEWSSCPGCFTPGERVPSTHWIGLAGPRAGLDDTEK